VQPNEITEVLNRPISQELLARDVARLAYVAKDGTPRTIPIIFTWNGSEIVMSTPKNAPKLRALGENPMVALTIDTEVHPPKILLIRGRAELDFVDGIPDEYLQATSSYEMTPEQRVEWEADRRDPDLGEADRLRGDPADRGRGADPAAGGASARSSEQNLGR
jgi:Pyridoxamine 5'-phosphate oxidase